MITPLTNLLASLFRGQISKNIVDVINKFGSEIPSEISYSGIIIPVNLTEAPII